MNQENKLIPLTEWPKYHSWPPIGGLRHLVFYAAENGFNSVVRRVGKRVLLDEQAFFSWVSKLNGGTNEKV
jgi:hypothetical protein